MFNSRHTQAVLAVWSICGCQFVVSSNQKEHRFHLTVSHFYQFRNLRSRDTRCFVSFSFFYSTRASSLLKNRSSLSIQISKNPAYLSSVSYLVSSFFFYLLDCCSSLPVKKLTYPGSSLKTFRRSVVYFGWRLLFKSAP